MVCIISKVNIFKTFAIEEKYRTEMRKLITHVLEKVRYSVVILFEISVLNFQTL